MPSSDGCNALPSRVSPSYARDSSAATGSTGHADERAAYSLCLMLAHYLQPKEGIARCMVKVQLVDAEPTFVSGTLLEYRHTANEPPAAYHSIPHRSGMNHAATLVVRGCPLL